MVRWRLAGSYHGVLQQLKHDDTELISAMRPEITLISLELQLQQMTGRILSSMAPWT